MQYTRLISVVQASMPGWHHFGLKITQTLVFLDCFETVPDGNWDLKVHKNQCFMNDQLRCGKCQQIFTETTG